MLWACFQETPAEHAVSLGLDLGLHLGLVDPDLSQVGLDLGLVDPDLSQVAL